MNDGGDFYVEGLMELSAYRLERAEPDAAWDAFVDRSPQGTIFSQSEFLAASGRTPSLWYCLKNDQVMGAAALVEADDGRRCIHSGLLVYNGILFAPGDPNQNAAQVGSEHFRVTSAIIRDLTERYDGVEMAVSYAFADLRPFLWHNYGAAGPHFEIVPRYTSLIDLSGATTENLNENPAYLACNKSRRQDLRYANKAGIETREAYEPDLFETLYRRTFEAQGLDVPADEIAAISASVERLHATGRLKMFQAAEPGAPPGSVAVFGIDGKRAYYLYGANDPDQRAGYTGSAVLWEAFRNLAAAGVPELDLEGINSPKRGYFKLSFGGSITPYHILRLRAD